jgi:pyruvate,orthophosphate dikinase
VDKLPGLVDRVAPIAAALDRALGAPVQARFVIERGVPWLVSVHPARLSPDALARTLVRRVGDGRLTREAAIASLTPDTLEAAGKFELETDGSTEIARGLAASPGAASGRIATSAAGVTGATDGDPRVIVVDDAAPEDAAGIRAASAIVATSGGLTADAAIAARALRKPCVVSAPIRIGPGELSIGDWITVDGTTGAIHRGRLPVRWRPSTPEAAAILGWLEPRDGESPAQSLAKTRQALRGA